MIEAKPVFVSPKPKSTPLYIDGEIKLKTSQLNHMQKAYAFDNRPFPSNRISNSINVNMVYVRSLILIQKVIEINHLIMDVTRDPTRQVRFSASIEPVNANYVRIRMKNWSEK